MGHDVFEAADGHSAIELGRRVKPRLALLDYRIPGIDGLHVFKALRAQDTSLIGVMLTGYGSVEHAFECARSGIAAYFQKPIKTEQIQAVLSTLLERDRPTERNGSESVELVGTSRAMTAVREQIQRLGPLSETVLVTGESGTGKELVARSIHLCSSRAGKPYVDVNCAALPTSLFESEFFGHERGSFTDARDRHIGHFERASTGTLFLDEIGELQLETQAKLLRAVEQQTIRRIGGTGRVAVSVRVIAATNVDLAHAVAHRTFRSDLFHRLNTLAVRLPPLRDRLDDLPKLAEHFLAEFRQRNGRPFARLTPSALERLRDHQWPGNIRELQNTIRQAFFAAEGDEITVDHIGLSASKLHEEINVGGKELPLGVTLAEGLREQERIWLATELSRHDCLASAAKALGMDPKTLYGKRKRYGL